MNILRTFFALSVLMFSSKSVIAAQVMYTFEGTVTGFESFHPDYDISDFNIVIGETSLTYTFVVDLEAEQSTFTNTAGTWHYFYSDLLSGSIVNGGQVRGDLHGYNWYSVSGPDKGQITSNLTDVRIATDSSFTADWRVEDWQVGQSFISSDLACYPDEVNECAGAVYAYGDVTLTAMTVVPLPAAVWLFGSSLAGLGWFKRKQTV